MRICEDQALITQDDAAALAALAPLPIGLEARKEVPFDGLPIDETLSINADNRRSYRVDRSGDKRCLDASRSTLGGRCRHRWHDCRKARLHSGRRWSGESRSGREWHGYQQRKEQHDNHVRGGTHTAGEPAHWLLHSMIAWRLRACRNSGCGSIAVLEQQARSNGHPCAGLMMGVRPRGHLVGMRQRCARNMAHRQVEH